MTTQDWLPGLDEDLEQPAGPATRRLVWLIGGALAAVVVLGGALVEHGLAATSATTPSVASPSGRAGDRAQATPLDGARAMEAGLNDPAVDNWPIHPLVVTVEPIQGGAAPDRVPNFDSCQAVPATLQYLPVQIRRPDDYLSATFTVERTASTPADVGRIGFFFQAGRASTPCADGVWSTSDSFLANLGQQRVIGYVVFDQAFTEATPQGRPDVFSTLRLRVSDLRSSGRPLAVSTPTIGSLCPGTHDEVCAPLG